MPNFSSRLQSQLNDADWATKREIVRTCDNTPAGNSQYFHQYDWVRPLADYFGEELSQPELPPPYRADLILSFGRPEIDGDSSSSHGANHVFVKRLGLNY